jgi:hypothetical protein
VRMGITVETGIGVVDVRHHQDAMGVVLPIVRIRRVLWNRDPNVGSFVADGAKILSPAVAVDPQVPEIDEVATWMVDERRAVRAVEQLKRGLPRPQIATSGIMTIGLPTR